MPNTDPIGEALGKEGTSSLIPSIPPIFNNGLDSRDSRPLPYPQSLDSGNFPISDAENSSLIDSIIEPPGSIVNELNADAEADTLILNQTDSSSLIKELSVPLNDSQPTNSELDTLIGSLQEEPGIPSEQKPIHSLTLAPPPKIILPFSTPQLQLPSPHKTIHPNY